MQFISFSRLTSLKVQLPALALVLAGSCAVAQPSTPPLAPSSVAPWSRFLSSSPGDAARVLATVKEELARRGRWASAQAPTLPEIETQDAVSYLSEGETKAPPTSNKSLYEKYQWRLCFQAVLLGEQLTNSPIASERRQGLAVALWLMNSSFLSLRARQMPAQIADGLVIPALAAAPDEPEAFLSRLQLLRVVAEVYQLAGRKSDANNALRAVIATADGVQLNLADGARYQLAFRLHGEGKNPEALALLDEISHDALRDGAKTIAAKWRRSRRS